MNIAIMTIQSVNYGNRLQNYALQTVLNGLGNQAHSLRRDAGFNGPVGCKLRAIKHGLGVLRHRSDSYGAFRRFDNNYISFSDSVVSEEYTSPNLNNAYGCYVIGSDQSGILTSTLTASWSIYRWSLVGKSLLTQQVSA